MSVPQLPGFMFFEHLSKPVPPILYHYTSMDALANITKTQRIWATDASYLNDSRECTDAEDILYEELNKRVGKDKHLQAITASDMEFARRNSYKRRYIVSFTEVGDSLSQWRAYCPGGSGVAIGFSSSVLQEIPARVGLDHPAESKVRAHLWLYKCIYKNEEKVRLVDGFVNYYLSQVTNGGPHPSGCLELFLRMCAPSFKDAAFSEEVEWRMVLSCGDNAVPDPEFRSARGIVIPYIEMAVWSKEDDFIKEVVIAPSSDAQFAAKSIRRMLDARGLARATVKLSKAPYRSQ